MDERSVVADLHVHTTVSDGDFDPQAVAPAAREAGLEAVAITDHDRPQPTLDEPVATADGVTVVHGIELRVETDRQRVDLLGYGLDPTPALLEECERLQRDRVERGRRIVERVEEHLDVTLDVALTEGIGRPHIARAIAAHPDLEFDAGRAFADLIGEGCPCYVPRDVTSLEDGLGLLRASAAIVSLAHPLRYDDPEAALSLAPDLDAIERAYPYDRPVGRDEVDEAGRQAVERAIDEHDLLATGGSDAHGHSLGGAGLDETEWDAVRAALRA